MWTRKHQLITMQTFVFRLQTILHCQSISQFVVRTYTRSSEKPHEQRRHLGESWGSVDPKNCEMTNFTQLRSSKWHCSKKNSTKFCNIGICSWTCWTPKHWLKWRQYARRSVYHLYCIFVYFVLYCIWYAAVSDGRYGLASSLARKRLRLKQVYEEVLSFRGKGPSLFRTLYCTGWGQTLFEICLDKFRRFDTVHERTLQTDTRFSYHSQHAVMTSAESLCVRHCVNFWLSKEVQQHT